MSRGGTCAPDIAEAVLGVAARKRSRRLPWALIAALAGHAIILGDAYRIARGLAAAAIIPGPVRTELAVDLGVAQPRAPSPPPAVLDKALPERRPAKAAPATAHTAHGSTAVAAQAATVIAHPAEGDAPIDLTADAVVTGKAVAYAGGLTASNGTSRSPVGGPAAGPEPHPGTSPGGGRRPSPVSLATEDWSCPWPTEADADRIDEQTVVIRVVVNAGGDPQSAAVLADPGHGFGPAARACAMRTHFTPARDARGEPISATSPPIRVRFTR